MQKNVSGQRWIVFAFGRTSNTPITGDAANITANLRLDGGAANPVDDTNPQELEAGYYYFDITQAETNADMIAICPVSATPNVIVIGVPGAVWTEGIAQAIKAKTDNLPADPASITQVNTRLATSGYTAPANADITAIKAKTDNLPSAPASEGNVQGHVADALAAYDPPTKAELDAAQLVITNAISALHNATQGATAVELAAAQLAITNAISALHNATQGATKGELDAAQLAVTNAISALHNATQGATKTELDAAVAVIEGAMPSVTGLALEATLTAMKGTGWTTETLVALMAAILDRLAASDYTAPDNANIITIKDDVENSTYGLPALLAALQNSGAVAGSGAITWVYTLINSENSEPIGDADIWVTTDSAGNNVIASGKTDQNGQATFYLDAGIVYVFRQKSGWNFDNPDQEVVS